MLKELVDSTRAALDATPGVRRGAPALAAAWHEIDRTHVLYETRRRTWQAMHGRRPRFALRAAFTPEAPRYFTGGYRLCVRLNIDVVAPARADVVLHWADVTIRDEPPPGLDPRTINLRVRDISKRHVNEVHRQVFGYGLDPEPGATEFVEKSDVNARHDGRVVVQPSGAPGTVIERLVDNRLDDHLVTDFRVAVMDGRIIYTLLRYRPISDRFQHRDTHMLALVVEPEAYFSPAEQATLVAMCQAMGADWADLDVLRDRTSRRAYVVDVNPTPAAPSTGLAGVELAAYWRLQEQGFAALLRAHAR
ncbi:MAG: hypothetical protein ACHQZR_06435 [Candidatus Limnocylindrales bacterium]